MKISEKSSIDNRSERGAALVTVLLISLLLGTACVALLIAVGASSKNNTDVLAEGKAYYAAESGLQATINVLRNDSSATYAYASANPTLSGKLTYSTVNGVSQVLVGSEAGYSIYVTDPDNSGAATTFSVIGSFQQADGTYAATRVFTSGGDTTTISYVNRASTTVTHPMGTGTSFGAFRIQYAGTSPAPISEVRFKLDYTMTAPRPAVRSLRGKITAAGEVIFDAPNYHYNLMGSSIDLCATVSCSPIGTFALTLPTPTQVPQDREIFGQMSPIEPYRLLVHSTGYGPNSSKKQLEAVMQRNFFNDLGASSAISMIGPGADIVFNPGPSHQMDINGGSVPSIGVSDTTGLQTVNDAHTNGTMTPPPAVLGDEIPDWQQSATAMDTLVRQLRQTAQNSGRYFTGGPNSQQGWGDFTTGTGITFCEGSCNLGGNTEGGGILVVTGTFSTSGSPKFRGLVLAVGPYVNGANPGGIVRSGNGNELFIGNIVIAPYDPNNLIAGFSSPRYQQNGGPGDTIYSDVSVDTAFGGTSAISNFMLGVAEK